MRRQHLQYLETRPILANPSLWNHRFPIEISVQWTATTRRRIAEAPLGIVRKGLVRIGKRVGGKHGLLQAAGLSLFPLYSEQSQKIRAARRDHQHPLWPK